jgi:hypothetical protein
MSRSPSVLISGARRTSQSRIENDSRRRTEPADVQLHGKRRSHVTPGRLLLQACWAMEWRSARAPSCRVRRTGLRAHSAQVFIQKSRCSSARCTILTVSAIECCCVLTNDSCTPPVDGRGRSQREDGRASREQRDEPRMVTSSHCATMRASTGRRAPNLRSERAEVMEKSIVTIERRPVATLSLRVGST